MSKPRRSGQRPLDRCRLVPSRLNSLFSARIPPSTFHRPAHEEEERPGAHERGHDRRRQPVEQQMESADDVRTRGEGDRRRRASGRQPIRRCGPARPADTRRDLRRRQRRRGHHRDARAVGRPGQRARDGARPTRRLKRPGQQHVAAFRGRRGGAAGGDGQAERRGAARQPRTYRRVDTEPDHEDSHGSRARCPRRRHISRGYASQIAEP